jgi:uncharacterized protein involved in exopolysaccharide biosynthesis
LEDTIDLRPYFAIMRQWYRFILGCAVIAGVVGYVVAGFIPPVYEAEAVVAIVRSDVTLNLEPKFKTEVDAAIVDPAARRRSLTALVKSSEIAEDVISHPRFGEHLEASERNPNELLKVVSASNEGDLIRIKVSAKAPDKAALLANGWAQLYESRVNALYGELSLSAVDMQAQIQTAKGDYDKKEAALVSFLGNNTMNQLELQLAQNKRKLDDLVARETHIERLLTNANILRKRLASGINSTRGDELSAFFLEVNAFSTFITLPVNLQISFDQLVPRMSTAEKLNSLDALIGVLEEQRKTIQPTAITQLQQEFNVLQAQWEQQASKRSELIQARELAWSTYTTLANKGAEISVAAASKNKLVRLAITAVAPTEAVWPRRALLAVVASLIGLAIGATPAFILRTTTRGVAPKT